MENKNVIIIVIVSIFLVIIFGVFFFYKPAPKIEKSPGDQTNAPHDNETKVEDEVDEVNCFVFNSDEGVITSYTDTCSKEVVIPEKINEVNVVKIGEAAFKQKNILSLKLPASLKEIGAEAFADNGIERISLPKNLNVIGDSAFANNPLIEIIIKGKISLDEFQHLGPNWNNDFGIFEFK